MSLDPATWQAIKLTLQLASLTTLVLLVLATPVAWWLARTNSLWRAPVGAVVALGQSFSEVESTKSVSDIYAPLSGKVSQVNDALVQSPELLNSDPYGDGWICEIELSDPAQFEQLLTSSAYQSLIGG